VIDTDAFRWSTYVQAEGTDLRDLFEMHFREPGRSVCYVLGRGFDPRMMLGLELVLPLNRLGNCSVVLLEFNEGENSPSRRYAGWAEENLDRLRDLVKSPNVIDTRSVAVLAPDGRRIGSRSAANLFRRPEELAEYTDIIVDSSSLPRAIVYPLLAKLLHLVERSPQSSPSKNLFVLAAENAEIDSRIVEEGIDEDADYIHLFRSGAERMAASGEPKIWIPVLGERQALQLRRIYDLVMPDEICPVLPSPSFNPRRADDLVLEYRELLLDQFRVEPRNFIYASERNPFEVYRQIRRAVLDYYRVLAPLGGCRAVVSSVSSKLLSIGALMAAYELKRARLDVGIGHIEAQGYRIEDETLVRSLAPQSTVVGLWLTGECYA